MLNHVQQTFNEDGYYNYWYEIQTSYPNFVNYISYYCHAKASVVLKYILFWLTYMRSSIGNWNYYDLTTSFIS